MENKCLKCGNSDLFISDLNKERTLIEFYMSGNISMIVRCLNCNQVYEAVFNLVSLDTNIHLVKIHPTKFNKNNGEYEDKPIFFTERDLKNA